MSPAAGGEVAERDTLRRLGWWAAGWSLLGVVAFLAAGRAGDALVLTGVAAAVIFAFRGLEGVVRRLRAEEVEGEVRRHGEHRLAWRWLLLAAIPVTTIFLGSERLLAVIAGVSVIPLAVISEAALRLAALGRNGEI